MSFYCKYRMQFKKKSLPTSGEIYTFKEILIMVKGLNTEKKDNSKEIK
jgi:hypothetical protein